MARSKGVETSWHATTLHAGMRVVAWATGIRIGVLLLGVFADWAVPDYDLSQGLFLSKAAKGHAGPIQALIGGFSNWDGVYFVHLALGGSYTYEHFHAFFPGMPLAIQVVCAPITWLLGVDEVTSCLVVGVLLANVCTIGAALVLYLLGLQVLNDSRAAFASALLFACSPAGVFLSAIYTEGPFALLTLSALLAIRKGHEWVGTLLLFLATAVRSNGIIYVGFLAERAVRQLPLHRLYGTHPPISMLCVRALRMVGTLAMQGVVVAMPLVLHLYAAAARHCDPSSPNVHLSPWCEDTLPNVYGHIQVKYWNNGFLRYWQMKQLPNFILAFPMVALTCIGVHWYLSQASYSFKHLWPTPRDPKAPRGGDGVALGYLQPDMLVYVGHWAFLVALAVFTMNVQVVTRFVCSTPALYWCAACIAGATNKRGHAFVSPGVAMSAIMAYFLGYTVIGTVLFVNFYPWT